MPRGNIWLLLLGLCVLTAKDARARPFEMHRCEQVTAVLEEPFDRDGDAEGRKLLDHLCEKLEELAPLFGLELVDEKMLQVFIPEDMASFTKRTGRSFFTLGVYSPRFGIIVQPGKQLKALRRRRRLQGTLTHELVHFIVDKTAGPTCPMWLNEGLAQWFEGLRPKGRLLVNEGGLAALERRWRSRGFSVAQRRQDYLVSLELTARVMRRVGPEEFVGSLSALRRQRDALAWKVKGRTLREWLFSADLPDIVVADLGGDDHGIVVERGVEWEQQLAEEVRAPMPKGAKVYDFNRPREPDAQVTPLPIDEMIRKAKKKKRKKRRR